MAELDALLKLPGVQAELDVVIGSAVKRGVEEAMSQWRQLGGPLQKRADFSGTVTAAQAGLATPTAFFAFTPPKPQVGRLWSVRKMVLWASGATPFSGTALANVTAAIFVTGQPGGPAALSQNPPNQDAEVTALQIPTTQYFSTHQLNVRGQEHLVVAVQGSGVVAGLQVAGMARLVELDDDPGLLLTL